MARNARDRRTEFLARRARAGDEAAFEQLLGHFGGLVTTIACEYYPPVGTDRDDLVQAGRIGLMRAVRDWQPARSTFKGFAALVIRRQVVTFIKMATAQKHWPGTGRPDLVRGGKLPISLDEAVQSDDGGNEPRHTVIADRSSGPAEVAEQRERIGVLVVAINGRLTPLERHAVIAHVIDGEPYQARGRRASGKDKSIDNAIQRARRKLAAADRGEPPPFRRRRAA